MRKFLMAAGLLALVACGDKKPDAAAPAMAPAADTNKAKGDSMTMKGDSMTMKADSMKMKADSTKMAPPKKP